MRFSLAREAGLDEAKADLIDDDHASHGLPERWEVALEFTDHVLSTPGPLPADLEHRVRGSFPEPELVELSLGLGLFHGFSKMLIALGLEPDHMDTTVLPTPAPSGAPSPSLPADNPYLDLLRPRPDLAARWDRMHELLWRLPAVKDGAGAVIRARTARLLAPEWAESTLEPSSAAHHSVQEATERFVIDVRAIDAAVTAPIVEEFGADGLVQLVMTMAVYDGIHRVAAVRG